MFPDIVVVPNLNDFFTRQIQESKQDSGSYGLEWEIDIGCSKKVRVFGLPNCGSMEDIHKLAIRVGIAYATTEKILTDINDVELFRKFGGESGLLLEGLSLVTTSLRLRSFVPLEQSDRIPECKIATMKKQLELADYIAKHPDLSRRVFAAGEKVISRIQATPDNYKFKYPDLIGISTKETTLAELVKCYSDLPIMQKIEMLLQLSNLIQLSLQDKADASVHLSAKKSMLTMTDFLPIKAESILEDGEQRITQGLDTIMKMIQAFDVKERSEEFVQLLENFVDGESERVFVDDCKRWKKTWVDGDLKTLKLTRGFERELEVTTDDMRTVAKRIASQVFNGVATTVILPLGYFTAKKDLIIHLKEQLVYPTQLVREMPLAEVQGIFYRMITAQGKQCGYLLGTGSFATHKMMQLNPKIKEALSQVKFIHYDVQSSEATANEEIPLLHIVGETDPALGTKLDFLLEEIVSQCEAKELSSTLIASYRMFYSKAFLAQKINIIHQLLNLLAQNKGNVVHQLNGLKFKPSGIHELVLEFAGNNFIHVDALGSPTGRQNVIRTQTATWAARIVAMPATVEGAKQFVETHCETLQKYNEAWISGDISQMAALTTREMLLGDRMDEVAQRISDMGLALTMLPSINDQALFMVGSANILGQKGDVVDLLRERKWRIERV